jgi:hypothetical protein
MTWFHHRPRPGDTPAESLDRSLTAAKRFLDALSVADLVAALVRNEADRAPVAAAEVDHIGFLAPPGAEALIATAAERAGFSAGGIAFPSEFLARELAARAGRTRPTTVVKHFGHTPAGRRVAVEVFVAEYDAPEVLRWIAEGVGVHVALEVGREAFVEALRVLPHAGLTMPSFAGGRPHFIAREDVTIAYFDRGRPARPRRLEVRGKGDLRNARGTAPRAAAV